MFGLIITLLAIWLILSILGLVIKGLAWLAVVAIILFIATLAWEGIRRLVAKKNAS